MDDVTIRVATTEDVAAIRQVASESWHATYDDVLGAETVESVVDDWYDRDGLEQSVTRADGRFLVAETGSEGDIVGFAQGVLGDDEGPAWLPRIYVHPDYWGEGVGSRLLDRIESWLRNEDADRLRLAVIADNEVGNAFYETHGYGVVAENDEELFGTTFEEYVRERKL